jgi:lipopolysaccharide/colanic/teichoic acid biosynthesis glycosyltransferase
VGRAVKRSFDVAVALIGLVILSPLILAICAAIRWRMGGPVLFRQRRTGYRGRPFGALKFRSMNSRTDKHGNLLPDHKRIGRIGRLLRKTSLDEIPQLLNVLRGEMSIVGPRPLLPKYDLWYTTSELRRFEVRPGITGLAQVAGRNSVTWNDRLALDVEYVARWSLWLDVRILFQTVKVVLRREGVAEDPRELMADLDDERATAMTQELILQAEDLALLRG